MNVELINNTIVVDGTIVLTATKQFDGKWYWYSSIYGRRGKGLYKTMDKALSSGQKALNIRVK